MNDVNDYRNLFPHTGKNIIYLNHASVSPLSSRVSASIKEFVDRQSFGDIEFYVPALEKLQETRAYLSRLIKAKPSEISFQSNTSEGLNFLANSIKWKRGDRIISYDQEFPAVTQPLLKLKKEGVEIDFLKSRDGRLDADDLLRAIKPTTHLVSISHVQFLNGFRSDIETIGKFCHEKGILFCVDAIQSAGVFQIDVNKMKIDFLSCGGHKWLMGPQGTAFMYVSEELRSMISQPYRGWMSVEKPFDYFNFENPLINDSRRYEYGTLNLMGIYGLCESVKLILEIGLSTIEQKVIETNRHLLKQLQTMGYRFAMKYEPEHLSGIVSFYAQEPYEIAKKLKEKKIHIAARDKFIRVSPHFYNTTEEIDTFLDALKEVEYKIKFEKSKVMYSSGAV